MKMTVAIDKYTRESFKRLKTRIASKGKELNSYAVFCAGFKTGFNYKKPGMSRRGKVVEVRR